MPHAVMLNPTLDILLHKPPQDFIEVALATTQQRQALLAEAEMQQGLSDLVQYCQGRVKAETGIERVLDVLRCLHNELGFHSDVQTYYSIESNYLDTVLVQRCAAPVMLAMLYCHIGKQLGLGFYAISVPGYMLLGMRSLPWFVDPGSGRLIDMAECRAQHKQRFGPRSYLRESDIRPLSDSELLAHFVQHLKDVHLLNDELFLALQYSQWLALLRPNDAEPVLDQGLLYEKLGFTGQAREIFAEYLLRFPTAKAVHIIADKLQQLQGGELTRH